MHLMHDRWHPAESVLGTVFSQGGDGAVFGAAVQIHAGDAQVLQARSHQGFKYFVRTGRRHGYLTGLSGA